MGDYVLSSSFSSSSFSSSYFSIDTSHLPVLLTALWQVYQWFDLGLQLGVPYHSLKKIEKEQGGAVEDSKREMLVAWLKGQGASKQALMTALRNMKCNMAV